MKRKIEGHADAVLCCHAMAARKLLVSGGEDGLLCFTDLNTLSNAGKIRQTHGDAVTSVCTSSASDYLVYASAGRAVLSVDLRKGLSEKAVRDVWSLNQDEVNHITVNHQGSWLAAADDSGEVQVINLQQPRDASGRPTYKTLRRGHSNICSVVAFRPHRPWELISGGLDATVVRWDFNRLRPQQTWNLNAEAAASGGQVFNPPMVHSLVVPDTVDRSLCRLMGVGRGDGYISLYDIDSKSTLPAGASSGGGSKKKGSKAKQKAGCRDGSNQAAASQSSSAAGTAGDAATSSGIPASEMEDSAAAPAAAATAPDTWRVPFIPGRLCLLGREQGGHTAAVNCLQFMHGSNWQRLLSAGNDGRLILWDWQAAAAKQGTAWRGGESAKPAAATAGTPAAEVQVAEQPTASAAAAAATAAAAAAAGQDSSQATLEAGGSAADAAVVVADVKHGRKVNWVCTCEPVGGYNIFVADVTQRMTAMGLH